MEGLHLDDPTVSVNAATSDVQPPQTQATTSSHKINSLQEAIASLHIIQKITINERDMKTILVDTKTVLESKLSEHDQRLDKADNVFTGMDNTTQSLVQLQMTYPWLQVKLMSPPNAPLGACCLHQHHSSQIRSFHGFFSTQKWLDCSVVLDSNHRVQKIKSHKQSDCHKVSTSFSDITKERRRCYREVHFAMMNLYSAMYRITDTHL